MSSTIWSKFFWSDWANDPALRLCSLAAQGLWMRMLCLAAESDPIGYVTINGRILGVTDIARLTGVTETEVSDLLDEMDRNGVFSRDRKGRIYSRRMVRDAKRAALARKNGKQGGNPTLSGNTRNSPRDNPPDKGQVKPQEPYAICQEPERENTAQPEQEAARQMPSGAVAALRWAKDEIDRIEAECRKAAEIGGLSPCWLECSAIIGLMEAGYDLERDILPQIRSQTQRLGKPAGSPNYYVKGIREAADRRREIAAVPKPSGGASDDEWRKRMERWRDSGKWSEARSWGAPPGQAGCVVPDRILLEFPVPLPRAVG